MRALSRLLLIARSNPNSSDPEGSQAERIFRQLQVALSEAPFSAAILNDLAAVHLMLAERRGDPHHLFDANRLLLRAISHDPRHAEAHFNRALILQTLGARRAAREAWNHYLALDSDSPWAVEAQVYLQAVEHFLREAEGDRPGQGGPADLAGDPRAAQEKVLFDLLPKWAAQAPGTLARAATLQEAQRIMQQLENSGDPLTSEAFALVEQIHHSEESAASRSIRRGIQLLAKGRRLALESREGSEQARAVLSQAQRLLTDAAPFQSWATFFLAYAFEDDRLENATRLFEGLNTAEVASASPWLGAEVSRLLGRNAVVAGDPVRALSFYLESVPRYLESGDPGRALLAKALSAECLEMLGRDQEAWQQLLASIQGSNAIRAPEYRSFVFVAAADLALLQGEPSLALIFQDEALAIAEQGTDELVFADSLLWRAMTYQELGRTEAANHDLALAQELLRRHQTRPGAERLLAMADVVQAHSQADSDPRHAVARLTSALETFQGLHREVLSLVAYEARSAAFQRLGLVAPAEEDLLKALDIFDAAGALSTGEDRRLLFSGRIRDLYDRGIEFFRSRQMPDRALELAERAHVSNLSGLSGIRALDTQQLLTRLPQKTALVYSVVLKDKLLLWLLHDGVSRSFEVQVSSSELVGLVQSYWNETYPPTMPWPEASHRLYDLLIRPWHTELVAADELVIWIPDKALYEVSLGGLQNPQTGRFFAEDFATSMAPNASLLFARSDTPEAYRSNRETNVSNAQVFGNPTHSRAHFPLFLRLPGAEREAERVAEMLGTEPILGPTATRELFLQRLGDATIVHFAGHAVFQGTDPRYSGLVLAPDHPKDSGMLYAWELSDQQLESIELVVLSACQSGGVAPGGPGGIAGLTRALLSAGASQLLTTLRPIGDAVATPLIEDFYRGFLRHGHAADALRDAVRRRLREDPPATHGPPDWVLFQVVNRDLPTQS